jgi:hypothetical protein
LLFFPITSETKNQTNKKSHEIRITTRTQKRTERESRDTEREREREAPYKERINRGRKREWLKIGHS